MLTFFTRSTKYYNQKRHSFTFFTISAKHYNYKIFQVSIILAQIFCYAYSNTSEMCPIGIRLLQPFQKAKIVFDIFHDLCSPVHDDNDHYYYYFYYHYYYYYYYNYYCNNKNTLKIERKSNASGKKIMNSVCYCSILRTLSLVINIIVIFTIIIIVIMFFSVVKSIN